MLAEEVVSPRLTTSSTWCVDVPSQQIADLPEIIDHLLTVFCAMLAGSYIRVTTWSMVRASARQSRRGAALAWHTGCRLYLQACSDARRDFRRSDGCCRRRARTAYRAGRAARSKRRSWTCCGARDSR